MTKKEIFASTKPFLHTLLFFGLSTLPLLIAYCFHIVGSYSFDNDFGRDLVDIFAITRGDITLLGPKLSFGGLHTGPFYYYLFTPVLWLFPNRPEALLYANAVLTWIPLVLLGSIWRKIEKWSLPVTILALYWIGLSNYLLFSARGPGNAFSYIGWLVLLIGVYPRIWKHSSKILWGLYGLFWGVVVNFHLVVLFIAAPLLGLLALSALHRNKRGFFKSLLKPLFLTSGFIASFAPLLLFELTHNFVMIRNTFVDKSYVAFTDNTNLINPLQTSTNPFTNFWLFTAQAGEWLQPSLTAPLILSTVLTVLYWKKLSGAVRALAASLILSLALVAVVATSQLAFHYFFPFIILAQIALIWLVAKKSFGVWLIGVEVLFSIIYFPVQWYGISPRPIESFRTTVEDVAASDMAGELAAHPFAVYVTRETPLAPIGSEYRYFLLTHGLKSVDPSAYSQAERLLWFAEQPLTTIENVSSWELDQFGPRRLINQRQTQGRTVYLFERQ